MMPIFFHIESHLWIAYLFFINGALLHYLFRSFSTNYLELTSTLEAQFLASFFISISLNGLLLLGLDLLNLEFRLMLFVLPVICIAILTCVVRTTPKYEFKTILSFECDYKRLALYLSVFIMLFYNGGLIEQISDAWWHMSLANKIGTASSFDLETGHLNGRYSRYYPPLWHGNLALANILSGISIPVFWNSFTAWGAVIKVMSFYLFALSLSGQKSIATLGALLFVLLPGVGDSFLRVSAWPSHIAYTAWFSLFFISFSLLNQIKNSISGFLDASKALYEQRAIILTALTLLILINFAHQAELLWFAMAFLFYFIGISAQRVFKKSDTVEAEQSIWLINLLGKLLLVGALILSVWFVYQDWKKVLINPDGFLVYFIPILTLLVFCYLQFQTIKKPSTYFTSTAKGAVLLVAIVLLLSIDLRHLLSLFNSELAYPKERFHELPLHALGWFGEELKIPGWHLQLRFGLLYSGILSIPLALFLAFYRPSRLTLFLASTSSFALLFCASPYLYHWLQELMNYHSPWRISLMIFHPITLSVAIVFCWQYLMNNKTS